MGRALDAAIRVDSGGVSRHHARITVTGDRALLEDMGSKNGTFLSDSGLRRRRCCTMAIRSGLARSS